MSDYTIFQIDEQCLRLDTQDGVTGMVRATKANAVLVALYLRLGDHDKERIIEMMMHGMKRHVEKEFVLAMQELAEEETQYRVTERRARTR